MHRAVKMRNRYKRLYSVFVTFPEYIFIKLQAFFIRFFFVTPRENTAPRNRKTVGFETHFPKHCNIFFVTVIHINGFHCRIIMFRIRPQHFLFTKAHRKAVFSMGTYIYIGKPSPPLIVCPFTLICSGCAAPQKSLRKTHRIPPRFIFKLTGPCTPNGSITR